MAEDQNMQENMMQRHARREEMVSACKVNVYTAANVVPRLAGVEQLPTDLNTTAT